VSGSARAEKRFLLVYRLGLALKAVDGAFELVAGLALWLLPDVIAGWLAPLTHGEPGSAAGHPLDALVVYWAGRADHELLAGSHVFAIVFLLLHGVVKLGLVYCLLRGFRWAYPWALAVLGAFVVFQLVVIVRTPTVGMVLLMVLDLVIVWLVWREWRHVKATDAAARAIPPTP